MIEPSGRDGDSEMGHTVVEAIQKVSDNGLDHCHVVILTRKGLDRVNRVPDGGHDYLSLVFY